MFKKYVDINIPLHCIFYAIIKQFFIITGALGNIVW